MKINKKTVNSSEILESQFGISTSFIPLLDNLYEGVYIIDKDRKIYYWNKSAEKITGYTAKEVIGKTCYDNLLRHTDKEGKNLCENLCPMVKIMNESKQLDAEIYLHHKTGYRLLVKVEGFPIKLNNSVVGVIELFYPILSTNNDEENLLNVSLRDSLTKVYNRKGFEFIYPLRQTELSILGYKTGVMFFDIDDFKKINDTYGHEIGDKVLFAVAQTFVNILRHNNIVVRWGGEEFLLITFIRENKMINTIGNKIVKIIQSTFIELENQIIRFTVSGGGTLLREEEDILNAINRADKLMYKAKKECKSLFISDVSYI